MASHPSIHLSLVYCDMTTTVEKDVKSQSIHPSIHLSLVSCDVDCRIILGRVLFLQQIIYSRTGLPLSGKNVWKMNFFPGQGKVREFC